MHIRTIMCTTYHQHTCMLCCPADLLPSYEASSVTGTQVLAAQPCRSNAYCPGTTTPGDPGYITCPNGRWTINVASTSPYQCSKCQCCLLLVPMAQRDNSGFKHKYCGLDTPQKCASCACCRCTMQQLHALVHVLHAAYFSLQWSRQGIVPQTPPLQSVRLVPSRPAGPPLIQQTAHSVEMAYQHRTWLK